MKYTKLYVTNLIRSVITDEDTGKCKYKKKKPKHEKQKQMVNG